MRQLVVLHPFVLKRSGFAGTRAQRGLHCSRKWMLCGVWIHAVIASGKGCVPQEQPHIVSEDANSVSTKTANSCRTAARCLKYPENILFLSKYQLPYIWRVSHPEMVPRATRSLAVQKQAPEISSGSKNTLEKTWNSSEEQQHCVTSQPRSLGTALYRKDNYEFVHCCMKIN